jgi:cytochrome c oxidase subunit IV
MASTLSPSHAAPDSGQQQHPIGVYLRVWGLLFILSTLSYLVDYFGLHGLLRWSLIVLLALMKGGLIVAVFMHMRWERLSLITAILIPPMALLVVVGLMYIEASYIHHTRIRFFETPAQQAEQQVRR